MFCICALKVQELNQVLGNLKPNLQFHLNLPGLPKLEAAAQAALSAQAAASAKVEAQAAAQVDWREEEAVRRPAEPRDVAPAPAPDHPERGPLERTGRVVDRRPCIEPFVIPVETPLEDIPMHVEQTKRIGTLRPYRV